MALDHAGLDVSDARAGVDRYHAIHVLREIEHERRVARLSGEAGAAAAREYRDRVFARQRERRDHVALVPRNHDADGHLAIVRRIGGVDRASAGVEAHFAFDLAREFEHTESIEAIVSGPIVIERHAPHTVPILKWFEVRRELR